MNIDRYRQSKVAKMSELISYVIVVGAFRKCDTTFRNPGTATAPGFDGGTDRGLLGSEGYLQLGRRKDLGAGSGRPDLTGDTDRSNG